MTRSLRFLPALFGAGLLFLSACHKSPSGGTEPTGTPDARAVAQLPAPFSEVRLGMTQAELEARFPPSEDISRCIPRLVGGDLSKPTAVPGAERIARSRCARSADIGGPTVRDAAQMISTIKELGLKDAAFSDALDAAIYTWAQVRGAVRAGLVTEASLIQADRGKSETAYEGFTDIADGLFRGGYTFATSHQARREVSAVIADRCDETDPDRVRRYVDGALSVSQIDADAHSRVVYGKCRGPFLQHEKELARDFASRTGAFGGVGLARASQPDRKLKADDPASFAIYASRSKLEASVARVGVLVANALPDAERFWSGAVALEPAADTDAGDTSREWSRAVVWLRDGRVTRMLLNIPKDDKLGELPKSLAGFYGSPGLTKVTVTTWALADGVRVSLDIGASCSLVVDDPREAAAPVLQGPSAAAPSASAQPPTAMAPASSERPAALGRPASSARPATAPAPPPVDAAYLRRVQACCSALHVSAARFSGPNDVRPMNAAASQCDVVAGQVAAGRTPDTGSVRGIIQGRPMPPACIGTL